MIKSLYPFKFTPILKETVWGGTKLKSCYNKQTDSSSIGESWELSCVKGNISIISNGKLAGTSLSEILKTNSVEILGKNVLEKFGNEFPLLVKFIDAKENLSVQVHPNDALAKKRHGSFGKTEMWHVLQNDSDAKLVLGFNKELDKEEYIRRAKNNTIEDVLNYQSVAPNEGFLIPAGLVHAIGAGIILIEVQQTSDLTYRIYDYNRKDKNGNCRKLHVQESVDAIDFSAKAVTVSNTENKVGVKTVAECKYFNVQAVDLSLIKKYNTEILKQIDSFVILICFDGHATLKYNHAIEEIIKGDTVLLPAVLKNTVLLTGDAKFLEVYIQ
ncbi:MAG: class I mannose-6-phosphate isomerase [Endomicrobium sp.]|jgi:mannose-6-phosphate isomerase|nr:class I mannose-6-phosphate isomerase [Endomicrobium sp.]MDR2399750.1 class I mannose-6-phosphate isomerase [Endomicrobium sp.]